MIKFKNTIGLATLFILGIGLFACNNNKKLPIYGQREAKITKDAEGNEKVDILNF